MLKFIRSVHWRYNIDYTYMSYALYIYIWLYTQKLSIDWLYMKYTLSKYIYTTDDHSFYNWSDWTIISGNYLRYIQKPIIICKKPKTDPAQFIPTKSEILQMPFLIRSDQQFQSPFLSFYQGTFLLIIFIDYKVNLIISIL